MQKTPKQTNKAKKQKQTKNHPSTNTKKPPNTTEKKKGERMYSFKFYFLTLFLTKLPYFWQSMRKCYLNSSSAFFDMLYICFHFCTFLDIALLDKNGKSREALYMFLAQVSKRIIMNQERISWFFQGISWLLLQNKSDKQLTKTKRAHKLYHTFEFFELQNHS